MLVNLLVLSPRGARLTLFFVVIRVVYTFHKDLAVVNLVSHSPTEQLADSRTICRTQTFEVVSGTHGLKYLRCCSTALIDLCGAKVQ